MQHLQWLRNRSAGRCGAVLGGGTSLPGQLEQIPDDALLISVNHHAARLITPDYVVYLDKHGWPLMKDLPGIKVTGPAREGDIVLNGVPVPRGSAQLATWLACWLGCSPVLLAGMDCYQDPGPYFYETDQQPRGAGKDLEFHIAAWGWCFKQCVHPERIAALGGPTGELFGYWDGTQRRFSVAQVKYEVLKRRNHDVDEKTTLSLWPGATGRMDREMAKGLVEDGIIKIVTKEKDSGSSEG